MEGLAAKLCNKLMHTYYYQLVTERATYIYVQPVISWIHVEPNESKRFRRARALLDYQTFVSLLVAQIWSNMMG
jgi:hypothetical protein